MNDFNGTGPVLYPAGGRYYPTQFTTPTGEVIRLMVYLPIAWRLKVGGFAPTARNREEDRLVAGVQGVAFGWDYNTAYSQSRSKVADNYIDGWVRESLLRQAILTGNVDVFSGRPLDATGQALVDGAKILETVRRSEAKVTTFDGRLSRELLETKAGPVALALGFERREEELDDQPQAVLFSGGTSWAAAARCPRPGPTVR